MTDGSCFVAMPFADTFSGVWKDYLEPAIQKVGLRPVRTDKVKPLSSPISMDILNGIVKADLVLADLTGGNPNVFYEVGIAHAIKHNTQVVLLTQDRASVPFDLRDIRCFEYDLIRVGIEPSRRILIGILHDVLEEHSLLQAKVESDVRRVLSPPANQLIEENRTSNILEIPYQTIAEPTSYEDVLVALPVWQGISDLLHQYLIEFGKDLESDREGYIWTIKAKKIFGVGTISSTAD